MKYIDVVAAIIKRDNRILATQRGYGDLAGGWEFPGGKIEAGETPEEALVREIYEELGTHVEIDSLVTVIDYSYDDFHLHMSCFLCHVASGQIELREHSAARWLDEGSIDSVDWLPADEEVIRAIKDSGILCSTEKGEHMGIMEIIRARHSVREYDGRAPEGEALAALKAEIEECSRESGLNIQLVMDNPEAFQVVARFGLIHGAQANIAFVTSNGDADDEAIGFWGQRIVLAAQKAGLNTCWVAISSRRKNKAARSADEKVRIVIAVGYGKTQGTERKTKPCEELTTIECDEAPAWFATAMEAAQLAPTAMNNQNFRVTLRADGKTVAVEAPKGGWNTVDLGIVKRNFQEAADACGADWAWEN